MAFGYKATVTVDNTKVSGTANLTNFPILVSGTYDGTAGEPDLRTTGNGGNVENADGYDIYFYSDSDLTSKLDHQIVEHNASTGQYIAYVEVPTLDYNDDTVIYTAYGDSSISADPSTSGTWNSNYKRVWPMHESSGTSLDDWTSNNKALTKKASGEPAASASGQIWRSQDYNDDRNDYAASTDFTGLDVSTGALSMWAYVESNDIKNNMAFSTSRTTDATRTESVAVNFNYRVDINLDMIQAFSHIDGTRQWTLYSDEDSLDAYEGTWLHFVLIQNGTEPSMYFNGVLQNKNWSHQTDKTTWFTDGINATNPEDQIDVGNSDAGWSSQINGYNDKLEMVTISTITDADWWKTVYNSEDSPSTFYTMGSETEVSGGGLNILQFGSGTGVRIV